ncbi:hypothetical protein ACWT_6145 [Actinoplanes sp. SE50]|nr:hypothetical protein ACWT_6145 [Actinoplanes sp. SE50]SLM02973.1 putative Rhs family protein fragment [Actinoplanes sp. SE50/110]
MTTAADPGYTVTYAYDAQGRVATRNGIAFGYGGIDNSPVLVPGAGHTPRGQIFRDPDSRPLSATLDGSPGRGLFADARHGDIRGSYDPADGSLNRSAVYDPSGEVVASTADKLPLGFQGGWSDQDTTLLNTDSRWYNPESAGFNSRDTYTLKPDPAAQANQYGYGNASPLNNIDADGHNPLVALGGVFLGSNPVGWAILGIVAVAGTGYLAYQGYQSYEYSHNVANSASSWGGMATQTSSYAYQQNAYAAHLSAAAAQGQAQATYQLAIAQAAANAHVAAMTAAYNAYVAQRIAAAQAAAARLKAETDAAVKLGQQRLAADAAQHAAAVKAAQPGPVGTTVVKPPAAIALVGGAGLVTNIDATKQLPGTVFAGAGGNDAPNIAAAAGAVAATEGLQIAGGDNGDDDGCGQKAAEDLAEGLADWVDPNDINFSQRTVSPNDYVQSMKDGTWDWNREGTALRVLERDGQLVSYDNRRLDAAREVRAEDPTYRVKIEVLDPEAANPAKSTGMNWDKSFEKRMTSKRNKDENGCRVPWQGLHERPKWE